VRLLAWLGKLITGGALDRVLETVNQKTEASVERDKLRADIVLEHYRTRGDYMRSGGFVLMLLFAVPLAGWHALVIYDSALGCADCVLANTWTVAALPAPLDEWAGWIVLSIFGVIGVDRIGRK
jgi:hypothetical protein